jgi:superfamily I DNA and/or RNA helicase
MAALKPGAQLVVAGDHFQMPPIVALEPPLGAEYLVGSIQTYLRERFGTRVHVSELHENYRSSVQLVEFARTIGYPSKLTAVYPGTAIHCLTPIAGLQNSLPPGLLWSSAWSNVLDPVFSTMVLLHEDDLSSQSNEFEARMVASLIWCLRQSVSKELDGRLRAPHAAPSATEFWSTVVGIVTPHRAQRAAVIKELQRIFPGDTPLEIASAVDTVERFQGDERHIIIVSFAVGDPDVISGEEAFLMQLERTNVAISRAMAKCIVMMPTSLAGHIPEDRKALRTAHVLKGYVDEYCNRSVGIKIADADVTRTGQFRWRG